MVFWKNLLCFSEVWEPFQILNMGSYSSASNPLRLLWTHEYYCYWLFYVIAKFQPHWDLMGYSIRKEGINFYPYYYYYAPSKLFNLELVGLSMQFELQVSSVLLDSCEYFNRFQQYCGLVGFDSSSEFRFKQSFCQAIGGLFLVRHLLLVSVRVPRLFSISMARFKSLSIRFLLY